MLTSRWYVNVDIQRNATLRFSMTCKRFMVYAGGICIVFAFLFLYKHNRLMAVTREQHACARHLQELAEEQQRYVNEIHALRQHAHVYEHARTQWGMKPVPLKRMHTLPKQESTCAP